MSTSHRSVTSIELRTESPDSGAARWCLDQYYRELDRRFEGGFDPGHAAYAGDPGQQVCFVVAWKGGAAAGCGSLVWSDRDVGEIKRMWVAERLRGMGLARRILHHLEDAARRQGLGAVRLDTNKALPEARALYRNAGYDETARYSDNPYAHHWFAKTLSSEGDLP